MNVPTYSSNFDENKYKTSFQPSNNYLSTSKNLDVSSSKSPIRSFLLLKLNKFSIVLGRNEGTEKPQLTQYIETKYQFKVKL